MTNTNLKKHPLVAELVGRMTKKKRDPIHLGSNIADTGPQISTAFAKEILERIDCNIITPNLPHDEDTVKQIQDWLASGDFSVQDLGNKLAQVQARPTCVGSNDSGRLWSKAWFARISDLEAKTGYELKYSIYELWIAFTSYFTEEKKINTKDAEIAELKLKLEAARNA